LRKPSPPYSAIVRKDGSTVWAEDSDGKTVASGEAGVDDASVIQSAIDSAPEYSIIYLSGNFQINNKITISKNGLHFIGNNCTITIATELGFEIYNGSLDEFPRLVKFENIIFDGKNNDVMYFKYCSDWGIINCEIYNAKHAVLLERGWGRQQLIFNSRIEGTPPDGEGLIMTPTPTEDTTNGLTVFNTSFSVYNPMAAAFHFPLQADGGYVCELEIISCHHEQDGKFMTGYLAGSVILGGAFIGNQGSIWLNKGKRLRIMPRRASNMYYGELSGSEIKVRYWDKGPSDKPLIQIDEPALVDIVPGFMYLDLNAPLIKVGGDTWSYNVKIHDADIIDCTTPAVIEVGSTGCDYEIYNILIRNINPNNELTESYGIKTNGITCLLKHVRFESVNHYTPVNDLTRVIAIGANVGETKFQNSGTATFSGDGATTQFSIAHGLVSTPTKVLVTPMTADAAADFYVTADDTYIYINYKSAPPSGTDNLKFSWYAEV